MIRFDQMRDWPQTMIIAHRGAGHGAKPRGRKPSGTALPSRRTHENTIEAFDAAIAAGADAIELDVRRTADGVLVVHHDAGVKGERRPIAKMTIGAVGEACTRREYRIPTLEEMLKHCAGRMALDIELKELGYEEDVVALTSRYYDFSHIAFTSFYDSSILAIKSRYPKAVAGLLLGMNPPPIASRAAARFPAKRLQECRADFVAPNWRLLSHWIRRNAIPADLPVIVWTVNNVRRAERYIENSVAGVISDIPENLLPQIK